MAFKILVCDKITDEGIKLLEEKDYEVTKAWDVPKDDLPKMIGEYDALVVRSATKVKGDLIANAKNLKVIGRAGIGLDNIDLEKAKEMGITVVNTPQASSISVAELAIGHLLALSRGVVKGTVTLREEKWAKKELKGAEVTIVCDIVKDRADEVAKQLKAKSVYDKKILFVTNAKEKYGLAFDLFRYDLETGKLEDLTKTDDVWNEHAVYSPDGSKIAWMSNSGYDYKPWLCW